MTAIDLWFGWSSVLVWWLTTLAAVVAVLYVCRVGDQRRVDEERFRAAARRYCWTVEE